MKVRKSTPIFVVDAITPATLSFWEQTGWKKEIEVPHGDDVGFVLLQNEGREIMLQSRASVKADLATDALDPTCALYNDVANLEEARAACKTAGGRIVIEERKTFYGAREMWVVDPAGILVGYAEIETV
jgi:uncharacterized glyoxalase superfamily protein PhnB